MRDSPLPEVAKVAIGCPHAGVKDGMIEPGIISSPPVHRLPPYPRIVPSRVHYFLLLPRGGQLEHSDSGDDAADGAQAGGGRLAGAVVAAGAGRGGGLVGAARRGSARDGGGVGGGGARAGRGARRRGRGLGARRAADGGGDVVHVVGGAELLCRA